MAPERTLTRHSRVDVRPIKSGREGGVLTITTQLVKLHWSNWSPKSREDEREYGITLLNLCMYILYGAELGLQKKQVAFGIPSTMNISQPRIHISSFPAEPIFSWIQGLWTFSIPSSIVLLVGSYFPIVSYYSIFSCLFWVGRVLHIPCWWW